MRKVLLASTIALLGLTSTAEAHFGLMQVGQTMGNPYLTDINGKGSPPCGPEDTGNFSMPIQAQGGHPLMIKVFESVGHLGFYRVALAINSQSELPVDDVVYDASGKVLPPSGVPSGTSDHAATENPAVFPVLADNFMAHETTAPNGATYMGTVMLPNVSCDKCVLQVIEFMHPHGFNTSVPGPGGGYFYHHCAELKITPDSTMPLFNPNSDGGVSPQDAAADGTTTTGAGGTTGTGGTGSGTTGTAGAPGTGTAGTPGTAGTGAGTAGTTGTGTGSAGSSATGSAGASASGTAGSSGAAGATGAAGSSSQRSSSSGGCNISGRDDLGISVLGALAVLGLVVIRRRSRT
jgi:hypothetical protein